MRINLIRTREEYDALVSQYSQKKLFSNDYIQSEVGRLTLSERLYECHTDSNLFLFVKRQTGFRLYYYIGDLSETMDIEACEVVTEILFRGEKQYPIEEIEYLIRCGLSMNLVRDQYCGIFRDLNIYETNTNVIIESAKDLNDIKNACDLFNDSFDRLSGDYIVAESYPELLKSNQIFVAKDSEDNFLGALHQTIEKGAAWISHVAVCNHARGNGVARNLVNRFISENSNGEKQRYMLWVQKDNVAAVSLYQSIGFKYMNKSSVSLIKL